MTVGTERNARKGRKKMHRIGYGPPGSSLSHEQKDFQAIAVLKNSRKRERKVIDNCVDQLWRYLSIDADAGAVYSFQMLKSI